MYILHTSLDHQGSYQGIQSLMQSTASSVCTLVQGSNFSYSFCSSHGSIQTLISSYTYWGLKTLTYLGLSLTNSSLFHLFSGNQTCRPFIWLSPSLLEFLALSLGLVRWGLLFSIFLNCQCCLNFIDTEKCVFL